MTIEEYLTSPTGAEDARALLSKGGEGKAQHQVPHREHYWRCWSLAKDEDEAWSRVVYHDIDTQPVAVYFRPYGDRFIVTDLGEAVRALRLRTGIITSPFWAEIGGSVAPGIFEAFEPLRRVPATDGEERVWCGEAIVRYVAERDVPAAICAMLLAAYRISNLGAAS